LFLARNLVVDEARMLETVRASRGLMLAEMLTFALAPHLGRGQARALVQECSRQALERGRELVELVRERTDAPLDWSSLTEREYLGASSALVDRVLAEAERVEATGVERPQELQ
jgi:3-carboxy-cis,cis-muconate cycloisomerase